MSNYQITGARLVRLQLIAKNFKENIAKMDKLLVGDSYPMSLYEVKDNLNYYHHHLALEIEEIKEAKEEEKYANR